jgi:hypothetical protein
MQTLLPLDVLYRVKNSKFNIRNSKSLNRLAPEFSFKF